ncbi:MAG: UMP kinase [Alphaproteobacteria bacterium]
MLDTVKQAKRVLIKVSGEFLMGKKGFGICQESLALLTSQLNGLIKHKLQIALVVGGGNFFRGKSGELSAMNRVQADHMGMLSTVLNGLALEDHLSRHSISCVLYSAVDIPKMCKNFRQKEALESLNRGQIPIFVGGIGNPFFSTDTAAVLRSVEMKCDVMIKATQVDGVYSDDPRHNQKAERFSSISYVEIIQKRLEVMDLTAVALAQDHNLPILVCSIHQENGLLSALQGNSTFTLIHE